MADRRQTPLADERFAPRFCTLPVRLAVLRRSPLFADLAPADLAAVNEQFREHAYAEGQVIFAAGEPAQRLYIVATGKVKLERTAMSGRDILLDLLTSGEFFGSLAQRGDAAYRESATAQTTCCVLNAAADRFRTMLHRYPPIALAALELTTARLRAAQELLEQQSGRSAEARIAALLLKLGDKLGEPHDGALLIQTPLSRQDIADMAGTTIETASRVLSAWRRDGLVQSGRRWVALADAPGLTRIAERQDA